MWDRLKAILFILAIAGIGLYLVRYFPTLVKGLPRFTVFSHSTSTSWYGAPPWFSASGGGRPYSFPLPSSWNFSSGYPSVFGSLYGYSNAIPDSAIPRGYTRDQLSPYFKRVQIGGASVSCYFNCASQVSLYGAGLAQGQKIDVTGWHIRGNSSDVVVAQAVDRYDPTGLAPSEDILLPPGGVVTLYSGTSAIGRNLRLNKCLGYLENTIHFNPSLPRQCPAVYSRGELINLSGQCQSYIMSVGACGEPDQSWFRTLPQNDQGNTCRTLLQKMNQTTCYDQHFGDRDFVSNQWLVWVGSSFFDPQHDHLILFDKQGLVADEYIY